MTTDCKGKLSAQRPIALQASVQFLECRRLNTLNVNKTFATTKPGNKVGEGSKGLIRSSAAETKPGSPEILSQRTIPAHVLLLFKNVTFHLFHSPRKHNPAVFHVNSTVGVIQFFQTMSHPQCGD